MPGKKRQRQTTRFAGVQVPVKGPGGQPTTLTTEIQSSIVAAIMAGCYVETAVAHAGVPKQTYYGWMMAGAKGHPDFVEFSEAVKKAVADRTVYHVNNIRTHAKDTWTASAWMLERTLPHLYGRRDRETIPPDEIPEADAAAFDPSLLTVDELKQLSELGEQVQELHDKGLPANVLEAEFEVIADKGTRNGKGGE